MKNLCFYLKITEKQTDRRVIQRLRVFRLPSPASRAAVEEIFHCERLNASQKYEVRWWSWTRSSVGGSLCLCRVTLWEKPRCRPTQMPASLLICHGHTERCQPSAASRPFTPVRSEAGDAVFDSPHTSIQATTALQAPDPRGPTDTK